MEKVNSENLEAFLEIQKTPDPPRKTWFKTEGKKSGLGIMAFWAALFRGNEMLSKSKKMTNAEIERQVRLEFPHEQTLMDNLDSGRQTVNYYRHLYNVGKLTKPKGEPPEHVSFRYNTDGIPVDTRTGKRPLSEEQWESLWSRYKDVE